ncbi:PAS domain S-box protein, partial [Candidatus Desantisbacteria bacterium]|nr:PAS domain S-box protein [Candidatus Desantisbacteria bacterium]
VFILFQKQKKEEKDEFFWIYIGLLGMNIVNGFHAVSSEGYGFLFLAYVASMIGSFGFILSWFSFPNKHILIKKWIIYGMVVISVLFGILVLLYQNIFPVMIQNNKYSSTAIIYNSIASLLYFISAIFLLIKGFRLNFIKAEYRIFCFMSLLFGLDAISLNKSLPWDDIWWFWSFKQVLSYLFLLGYLARKYLLSIHEAEEKYRTMIEYSNDLIWELNRDGNIIYINKKAEDMGGYKSKDIEGKYFGLTIVPDDLNRVEKIFIDTLTGKPNNYEAKICVKDSKIHVLSINTAPIYEDGEITGTVSFGRDITEQKNTENELWETHGYLEKLFSYANVPIVVWDTNSNITRFNHAFEHLTGYKTEEVIGKKLEMLFPDSSVNETLEKIKFILTGNYWETVEIPILCKNRDIKIALWNSYNIYAKDAKTLVAIIAQGQAITERKKIEEEIKKALYKIKKSLNDTVHALTYISEKRDPFTAGHQIRVSKIACRIAKDLNLSEEQIDGIKIAGLLHDIGKISIPSEILTKPGLLNNIEIKLIRTHSKAGFDILKEIDFPWPVAKIVLQHHERFNGSGYPDGLKGVEIIPEAKILAIADVIEAMSAHRPYRPAFSIINALEEISKEKGVLYDPVAADACLKLFYEKGFKIE